MDRLWSPWRREYVQKTGAEQGCIFCRMAGERNDEANLIVHRAARNFIVLNRYPYSTGHVMIVPYEHVDRLECATRESLQEMILLARECELRLGEVYKPAGFNLGMNIGEVAGAGIAGHIHLHFLPRWSGDANFMTTIAEARVLPEDLAETYRKLKAAFERSPDH